MVVVLVSFLLFVSFPFLRRHHHPYSCHHQPHPFSSSYHRSQPHFVSIVHQAIPSPSPFPPPLTSKHTSWQYHTQQLILSFVIYVWGMWDEFDTLSINSIVRCETTTTRRVTRHVHNHDNKIIYGTIPYPHNPIPRSHSPSSTNSVSPNHLNVSILSMF